MTGTLDTSSPGRGCDKGERLSFEKRRVVKEIHERYFRQIYRFCLYRLNSREAAEDVSSAVFLSLATQIDRLLEFDPGKLRMWLYGTARNGINAHVRRNKTRQEALAAIRRKQMELQQDCPDIGGRLDWPALHGAIRHLKQHSQEVVILRFFEGLRPSQIASILGKNPVTVRVTLSRAIKELRQQLAEAFGACEVD